MKKLTVIKDFFVSLLKRLLKIITAVFDTIKYSPPRWLVSVFAKIKNGITGVLGRYKKFRQTKITLISELHFSQKRANRPLYVKRA